MPWDYESGQFITKELDQPVTVRLSKEDLARLQNLKLKKAAEGLLELYGKDNWRHSGRTELNTTELFRYLLRKESAPATTRKTKRAGGKRKTRSSTSSRRKTKRAGGARKTKTSRK